MEVALQNYPGRVILDSVHLESGRAKIDSILPLALEHGAAVVALTIDESGMAKTAARKVEVARRIYEIVVGEYGVPPGALIFDALSFTLATGEAEFLTSAVETIEGVASIKRELPGLLTSLGISNVSFGLKPETARRSTRSFSITASRPVSTARWSTQRRSFRTSRSRPPFANSATT